MPLHTPFAISRETTEVTANWFVTVVLEDGTEGWGEVAPSPSLMGETMASSGRVLESLRRLIGRTLPSLLTEENLNELAEGQRAVRGGLEMALLDALGKCQRIALWRFFGGSHSQLETDVTIPILPPEGVRALTERFRSLGFRRFKIKLSGDLDQDYERIMTVSRQAPGCSVQLDANQAYRPETALSLIQRLEEGDVCVLLFEQPVEKDDWDGMAWLTQRSQVPIIADESVTSFDEARRLIEMGAADGINIKVMKTGFTESLQIIEQAKSAGLLLMIGAMVETELGLTAAAHLACGAGGFSFFDLDTHLFISDSPFEAGFEATGPFFRLTDRPGWGVRKKATGERL